MRKMCLRMEKTKAQMQSIAKAVQQTPTFTISIPTVCSLQGTQAKALARVLALPQYDDMPWPADTDCQTRMEDELAEQLSPLDKQSDFPERDIEGSK